MMTSEGWKGPMPALPPLPGRGAVTGGGQHEAGQATIQAQRACEQSQVARHNAVTGGAWFWCAGCHMAIAWWDHRWGRWETGDMRQVFVKDSKTRRLKRFTVPVTVSGRCCCHCSRTLSGWRMTAEPQTTQLKEDRQ